MLRRRPPTRLTVKLKCFFIWVILVTLPTGFKIALGTPLDDYVKIADSAYSWKIEKTIETETYSAFIIKLNSQKWRNVPEVNDPLWQHWLTVVKPKVILSDKSLLYVGNGNSREKMPLMPDPRLVQAAQATHSVVAEIRNVPNQPLIYAGDHTERSEDNSVAYSWNKVMTTGDPTWSIRFPMVKSIVRAMDTIQAIIPVSGFVVAGESKRGWATWLSAAVDKRIVAIIPLVIDVLNAQKFLKHHHAAYGFWAPAIKDYSNHHILDRLQAPEFIKLLGFEDPYSYRDRIKVPKYIINATGDQFFLPDSSQFYFGDLIGKKYLRYVPNTGHYLADSDVFESVIGFYSSIIYGDRLPVFTWEMNNKGLVIVHTVDRPEQVTLWQATNPKNRDFRIDTIGKSFHATILEERTQGIYQGKIAAPQTGYSAFFVELTYKNSKSQQIKFTTEVKVIPDKLPFEEKTASR